MPLQINLSSNINNASLQVGDTAYYITPTTDIADNGSTVTLPNNFTIQDPDAMERIGKITEIRSNHIVIENPADEPEDGDFLMFSKDKIVNNTSLLGYYAEVKLGNNSTEKAELFALGSEVTMSSK